MHRAAENAKAARFSWTASVLPFILDQFSMEQMTVKFFAFYILREFHIRQSGETKSSTILFFVTDNSDICTLSFVLIVLHYYSSLVEFCNDLKHGEESVVNHSLKMIRKTMKS